MDETKLTAALPNLDVQILHRTLPDQGGEAISITLTATPSFDAAAAAFLPGLAAGAFLPGARGPLALPFPPHAFFPQAAAGGEGAGSAAELWLAPLRLWMELTQRAWAPWLAMTALRRVSDEP
ncbi:hypothetical protein M2352_001654 [Azospirillum fermentarium]|uniref:hypothetical protein n=1 Tax=Azospirillum fermentarium TaxID=1233114 RepID=UPI0022266CA1|nr:hypothetical protein [Azospirillum fermentarium]MCW2246063.1 hypothetical protein [Azospirillum fermentarium]